MKLDTFFKRQEAPDDFYYIPVALFRDPRYKALSADTKLLYGIFLDRLVLCRKEGWMDSSRRFFLYFTEEEICEVLNSNPDKARALLQQMEEADLIERVCQGCGLLDRIYLKRVAIS